MGIKLVGGRNTKRTSYFLKAAKELQVPVDFVEWQEISDINWKYDVVKLDPFVFGESDLSEMNGLLETYRVQLVNLQNAGCCFLNTPEGILSVLDKRGCKEKLMQNGVSVTELLSAQPRTVGQLHEEMESNRMFSVFIKPVYSSGAAGVAAYRRLPGKKRWFCILPVVLRKGGYLIRKSYFGWKNGKR
jgi:Glutathione synthase/Ribosomal protein S6 modification enzyme (glutaminyl transferase)